MKKNKLTILTVALLTTLVSCGDVVSSDNGNNDGTTTISFFGWGSAEEQSNFQALVDQFMIDNPDIKVAYTASASDSYMTTLKNKGNQLPDVFYMPDYEFMQYADSGKLLALDSYVTEQEISSMWDLSTKMYR